MGCFFHSDASGNIVFVLGHDLHPGFDISVILDDHHIFSFQLCLLATAPPCFSLSFLLQNPSLYFP